MKAWSIDPIPVEDMATLDGIFLERVRCSPLRIAYRWFDRVLGGWRQMTWAEMGHEVARWRQALGGEELQPGDRVALQLRNCPEWVIFDQAALSLGLVTVPLYTDDRADNAAEILRDAGVKLLLMQDANRWKRLAPMIGTAKILRRVLLLDGNEESKRLAVEDRRLAVVLKWLPASGPDWPRRTADPNGLASIVYTSGTTGRPKGVMLSHRNILSNAQAILSLVDVYQEDVFLSFLPLSHMLERTGSYILPMIAGSTVAYARSVAQLGEDMQTIAPSVIIAVPRVFERVHARIGAQLRTRPAFIGRLFDLTVAAGWRDFERKQSRGGWHPLLLLWPLLRRVIGQPVLDKFGGRMRAAVSGGAPLPFEVAHLLVGLGLPLIQGYGLTETSPVIAVNPLENNRLDSVGVPLRGMEVRLGADSELQVKGPGVMLGYWNNPDATVEVLGVDGWLRTGDQARIEGRHLYITGRIKDILVLSNGEKVSPADMEMAIGLDPLFEQVLIVGEGHPFLAALLVLDANSWPPLAREFGLDPESRDSLANPLLLKAMLKRVRDALGNFPGYAKIRRVLLLLDPWTIDNGLMTPTLKFRRNRVIAQYHAEISHLYESGT